MKSSPFGLLTLAAIAFLYTPAQAKATDLDDSLTRYIDSVEEFRFNRNKQSISHEIVKYIKDHYSANGVIDSISFESYTYNDDFPGWIDRTDNHQYFAWARFKNSAEKFAVRFDSGKVIKLSEITKKSLDDKTLLRINKSIQYSKDSLIARKQIDDSTEQAIRSAEELKFIRDKKQILALAKKFIKSKIKFAEIDSIAFYDFTWSDSFSFPNQVTEREYLVWTYVAYQKAALYSLYYSGGKFSRIEENNTLSEYDEKLDRMMNILHGASIILRQNKYKENKTSINAKLIECIKEHANDPGSIQFLSAEVWDASPNGTTEYVVRMRGKNAFGALILGKTRVTLQRDNCISADQE